jgi:hypothetical protein
MIDSPKAEVAAPVRIVTVDGLAIIPPADHVIDHPWVFDSNGSGHGVRPTQTRTNCKIIHSSRPDPISPPGLELARMVVDECLVGNATVTESPDPLLPARWVE